MGFVRKIFDRSSRNDGSDEGPSNHVDYAPPPDPPPQYQTEQKSEAGPEHYLPPPGPPPSHTEINSGGQNLGTDAQHHPLEAPNEEPPSYHDWQNAVPDTSLLPPPPPAANDFSKTSNADSSAASRARDWCRLNPLLPPGRPSQQQMSMLRAGAIKVISPGPRTFSTIKEENDGFWSVATTSHATDLCFPSSYPLYYALGDFSPTSSGRPVTAYFELKVESLGGADRRGNLASIAIGFVAAPYPTFRMPGWERGSLAVHSDDGCRYVNNRDGGLDFVEPFQIGDIVGIGVKYTPLGFDGALGRSLAAEAFFTRNGKLEDTWNLQEETDAEDRLGSLGVEGHHDLYAAVGTFAQVGLKIAFRPDLWAYKPR